MTEETKLTITRETVVGGRPMSIGDELPGSHRDGNYLVAIGKATRSAMVEAKQEKKESGKKRKK